MVPQLSWLLRLPHTSRFFVVELTIFCRDQIGLNFVGPSACSTPDVFLSRLTALRLGAESSKIKTVRMAPIPLTRRKLKLPLFTLTFLRRIKRRRKSSTRTTWVKNWITRRNEQGVYNLIEELGNEDLTGFRWYFRWASPMAHYMEYHLPLRKLPECCKLATLCQLDFTKLTSISYMNG